MERVKVFGSRVGDLFSGAVVKRCEIHYIIEELECGGM